jgi:hypothetical protein
MLVARVGAGRQMTQFNGFDPTFDFRSEIRSWEDADAASPTLRAYHKLLWSKPLPNDDPFDLDDTGPRPYLHHLSRRGEFLLTSDAIGQTWTKWTRKRIADVLEPIPESEREQFRRLAGQMGGRILFPVRGDGTPTINVERGRNRDICDRFDLTLECIRLHYGREDHPLAGVFGMYENFFNLFESFEGYTDFFLLQDLVSDDSTAVRFFLPFDGFDGSPFPSTEEAYQDYRRNVIRFVEARNRRMSEYVDGL